MKELLYKMFGHKSLSKEEAKQVLLNISDGRYNDSQLSAFMTVFLMRSITTEELAGFREAILERRVIVDLDCHDAIDIVGTGGDGKNTFNISTAACFVVAGAGYPVVKHGNYGATSVSGASNVMEQHGVQFTSDMSRLRKSMDMCNIAYLHAPLFNSAMKAVASVRKALGVRTFFNMLGPLVNPALPKYQLLGVYNLSLLRLYNYVFQGSDTRFAVVHGLDGYDEISLTGEFKVATSTTETIYTPESIGFNRYCEQDLDGGKSPDEAARIFDRVLQGEATPAQADCVIANAAFAIRVIEPEKSLADCIALARESMESGRALKTLKMFVELNS